MLSPRGQDKRGRAAAAYVLGRGVGVDRMRECGVGYAPEYRHRAADAPDAAERLVDSLSGDRRVLEATDAPIVYVS